MFAMLLVAQWSFHGCFDVLGHSSESYCAHSSRFYHSVWVFPALQKFQNFGRSGPPNIENFGGDFGSASRFWHFPALPSFGFWPSWFAIFAM